MKTSISIVKRDIVEGTAIQIGAEEWFDWLTTVDSFHYETADGKFTARRYNNYWNAYRKRFGRLRQEYLGKTCDLTQERLQEIARLLDLSDTSYWILRSERKKAKSKSYRESSITNLQEDGKVCECEAQLTALQQQVVELEDKIQKSTEMLSLSLLLPDDSREIVRETVKHVLTYLQRK